MAPQKRQPRRRSSAATQGGGHQLVIVESPAKARTINKYLGPAYVVMASVGHVRDLPNRNPKGVKDPVPGVNLDADFRPSYEIIKGKAKTVQALKKAAREADGVWLATDLDREGEAIAWHLAQALDIAPEEAQRVVFNAITRGDIERAFRSPRPIDMHKVNAQQARRILDRIVGYQVSPLLWRKVAAGLSAGRVQSVAARLVVDREREIEIFVPEEYWTLHGLFTGELDGVDSLGREWGAWLADAAAGPQGSRNGGRTVQARAEWLAARRCFTAELVEVAGRKMSLPNRDEALRIASAAGFVLDDTLAEPPPADGQGREVIRLKGHMAAGPPWRIAGIQTKRTRSRPNAPFITSTLQQTAATQLGLGAQTTMRVAQMLYEGIPLGDMGNVGLITYMRTDSTRLSKEALAMARDYIADHLGPEYLPPRPQFYATSNKSAQEAHEAIRPTDVALTPERVKGSLSDQQFKVYRLIWQRFVGCQMREAEWDLTTVLVSGDTPAGRLVFRATGRRLVFDGHYRVVGLPETQEEGVLPALEEGQPLAALELEPAQHFTAPPPRYTEASLIRKLESEGIGRPSTYAQIIQVIQERQYVDKIRNRFYATDLGKVVTAKLLEAVPEILEVGYTRDMEQQLDDVADKQADWVAMLRKFYGPFQQRLEKAYLNVGHAKAEVEPAPFTCPTCGAATVYRFGRNGRFLSCARYPDCKYAAPIDRAGQPVEPEETDIACPGCGGPMLLRRGRFGPFLSCKAYPACEGLVRLDKKGGVSIPKPAPLKTDLPCPQCKAPLNLRRGAKGLWLSCSKFPKCRGRLGWSGLAPEVKRRWEEAYARHEREVQPPELLKRDGSPVPEGYKPQSHTETGRSGPEAAG